MIELPALEYHLAHGCNLSCQQCSHYADHHLAGAMPTVDQADAEYSLWSHRLRPKRFALLGGEPLLNPHLIQHLLLARQHWGDRNLMLVTNGFFLHRFPELPDALRETRCQLEVSQHGTHEGYLSKFREVKQLVWRWREQYPGIKIKIRQSHRGWLRQYRVVDGKPMPFNSSHAAAYRVCMQKTCTQLVNGCLAKCPALAYFPKLEAKLRLHDIPEWQPFHDYRPCPPTCSDHELRAFLRLEALAQCSLCPAKHTAFAHPDPMQR
jgi:organic radical activating enzyme